MKRSGLLFFILLLVTCFAIQEVQAQGRFIRKVKEKAEDKAIENIFDSEKNENSETDRPVGIGNSSEQSSERTSENRPSNTRGGGLSKSAPDIEVNIKDAIAAYDGKNYSDARFAIRQAIQGIELEIGENILKELPETLNELPMVAEEDLVTSTGIGFVGLLIERYYRKSDQELKVMIGNDSGLMAAANMYLMATGSYGTTSSDPGHKTVKVGDYRGVIEFDEYTGYKLTIPLGQTSVLAIEGINFDNETEILSAAEKIDIEKIKKELGEQ
ncbi:MAG TPA: hypothetical protein PLI65_06615 [Bacteroidales bacterium]|nr:hypothetical protein [Bacteroidales bacterium]HRW97142.1 hypothetical protein [Bacteroidales bacterium]